MDRMLNCNKMEIRGKIHCFFEQSGTFKNEFIKLGYEAYDYDIQNEFWQTDYQIDLFKEIEATYNNKPSIFDAITPDDLIMAFFPCIYFTLQSQMLFTWGTKNYKNMSITERTEKILERERERTRFYTLLIKLVTVAQTRGLRLILENPYNGKDSYLRNNFVQQPAIIDYDRTKRGDHFKKPTAYWYFNCDPTRGESYQTPKEVYNILSCKPSVNSGMCSKERSMISPDYARNFICDFILGKVQKNTSLELQFD